MFDHQGLIVLISCILLTVIASVAVALRFWARKLKKLPLGKDDHLALATCAVQVVMMVVTILGK